MNANITNIEDIVKIIREMGARVLIMGDPDTGKTSLIKEMLTRTNERFLVLDRSGEYRGFTDYYGIFPINPIDFMRADIFVIVAESILGSKNIGIQVPEEEWNSVTDFLSDEPDLDNKSIRKIIEAMGEWRPARSIPELLLYLYQYRGSRPAFAKAFNNQLWATRTHNLLYRWLMGGLGGSVGIDLSRVNERVATVYTYVLLFIIGNDPKIKINPPIVVIDWNHVLDISPVPIPSDIPPIIFTECGRVQNMDFITLLIRFQKTGMAHAEGLVESDIRIESGHIEPKPNARVFDCLDPNLPVVEYDSKEGRYVIRDFRERNAQCLIEAENVA
jgi:hypothetical protein